MAALSLCRRGAGARLGDGRACAPKPLLAAAILLAGFTTVDLAYNNGPNGVHGPAARRSTTCCEPDTRNATIAILKSKVVADDTRRDRIELAGLGFHWPNASLTHRLENTLGYNPVRLAPLQRGDRRRGPRRPARPAQVLAAVSLLPLDARQPAGPALHRHRRADREHRPHAEARRPAARSPAPATASSTRTRDAFDRVLFATEAKGADFARMLRDGIWPRRRPAHHRAAGGCRRRPAPPRRPGQRAHRQLPQHRGGRWRPTAPTAAGWSSTTSGTPGGLPRSTASRRRSCAPTSCSAPSPCRRAGIRCASRSARSPAPGASSRGRVRPAMHRQASRSAVRDIHAPFRHRMALGS